MLTTLILTLALTTAPPAHAQEAGYMILWDMNPEACQSHQFTGTGALELAAQDANVLRSLSATLNTAQADMAESVVRLGDSSFFYADYSNVMGVLTQMSVDIADDIARLDNVAMSFPQGDEVLTGRMQRRAQRLCRGQMEMLNEYSGLWTAAWSAAALINQAQKDAGVELTDWTTDWFHVRDTEIIRAQMASLTIEPEECLDDLDRILRDRGEFDCAD